MYLQQFSLAFLSGCLVVFSGHYLISVIYIHKKFHDKHSYFAIGSFFTSFYIFFQLLLSLTFSDETYFIFHKFKMIFAIASFPLFMVIMKKTFMPDSKNFITNIYLVLSLLIIPFIPFAIFTSYPVYSLEIDILIFKFSYHYASTQLGYFLWQIATVLTTMLLLFQYVFEKSYKRKDFFIGIIIALLCAVNDFAVVRHMYNNIMITEYGVFGLIFFIFLEFLKEDRKAYFNVINLSDELRREKRESERRLHIMEIYTRRSLVEAIERGDDPTKFVSKNVQITTLFSDIRDFTGISEGKEPIEVVNLLNSYFEQMNKVIIKYGGEIDKLMGDCIMALFHNPDDSLKAAIEMRKELTEFNIGVNNCSPIQNGIGLNYGEVIIGNIGSDSKMDYTVVGDIVNTASRLEALTKYYKVHLIISEEMKKQLEGSYHIRFLDEVLVKGKSNPMKIYEVFDFEPSEVIAMKERNFKPLAEAFAYYQQSEFEKAIEIYESVVEIQELPLQDPVLPFFISRCRKLQEQKQAGLLKQWSGVFEFMDK